jgi:hypothetical protein
MDPSILLPLLGVVRRELTRLIFLGLVFTYTLAALVECGYGGCVNGLPKTIIAMLERAPKLFWQGMASAYLVEFTGGFAGMTIGLAWDWWKQRPQKAAEKARTEAYAEAYAEAKLREMVLREMMLRAGIDPDTGEPLPPFNNGNGTTNGHTEK